MTITISSTEYSLICDRLSQMKSQFDEQFGHLTCDSPHVDGYQQNVGAIILREFYVKLMDNLKANLVVEKESVQNTAQADLFQVLTSSPLPHHSEASMNHNQIYQEHGGHLSQKTENELQEASQFLITDLTDNRAFDQNLFVEQSSSNYSEPASLPKNSKPKQSNLSPKRFICQHAGCYQSYIRKDYLISHKCASHGGMKPYRCKWPTCQFASTQKVYVKVHIRRKHLRVPINKVEQKRLGMAIDIGHDLNGYIEVDQAALDMQP